MNSEAIYLFLILQSLPKKLHQEVEGWRLKAGSYQKLYERMDDSTPNEDGDKQSRDLYLPPKQNRFEQLANELHKSSTSIVSIMDNDYPDLLKQINDPPPIIFVRGRMNDDSKNLAVVGTRRMTAYTKTVMPKFINPCVSAGLTVVSGLAFGVDAEAHTQTIKNSGKTWAVLGSGLADEAIYPKLNLKLAHQIIDTGGALISEYPPLAGALKHQFVARNRIIAGLSLGTLVVECDAKSGALITADFGMDYNRNVYAVPGPITSTASAGPNNLVKQGATLVTSGEEILADLGFSLPEKLEPDAKLSNEQSIVLKYIQSNVCEIEQLCLKTKFPITTLNLIISELEMNKFVSRQGPMIFPAS